MVSELIKADVEVEHEIGPTNISTMGKGGVQIRGPTKFAESSDANVTIRLGHEDKPVEYDDYETETGDWAEASTHLTLDEAEELYDALGDALEEEPEVMFEDIELENGEV